jgi:ankyrin repeat protein
VIRRGISTLCYAAMVSVEARDANNQALPWTVASRYVLRYYWRSKNAEIERAEQMTAIEAAKAGDAIALAEIIKKGTDLDIIDSNGMTPLMVAADAKRLDILKLLVKANVPLNAQDKWGQTALMIAAGRGDALCVKLLIAAGANLQLVAKNKLTALGYAAENSAKEVARLLRQAGAK